MIKCNRTLPEDAKRAARAEETFVGELPHIPGMVDYAAIRHNEKLTIQAQIASGDSDRLGIDAIVAKEALL